MELVENTFNQIQAARAEFHKFRQEDLTKEKDAHLLHEITYMINPMYKLPLTLSHAAKEAQDKIHKLSLKALEQKLNNPEKITMAV